MWSWVALRGGVAVLALAIVAVLQSAVPYTHAESMVLAALGVVEDGYAVAGQGAALAPVAGTPRQGSTPGAPAPRVTLTLGVPGTDSASTPARLNTAVPAPRTVSRGPAVAALPQAAAPEATADAVEPVVFDVDGAELIGYVDGLGSVAVTYGAMAGTRCLFAPGAMVHWSRHHAGGSACRIVLFENLKLKAGWRIEAVSARLGYGTSLSVHRRPETVTVAGTRAAVRTGFLPVSPRLPVELVAVGEVPLAGAQFWMGLEHVRLVGPGGAADWRQAFVEADNRIGRLHRGPAPTALASGHVSR